MSRILPLVVEIMFASQLVQPLLCFYTISFKVTVFALLCVMYVSQDRLTHYSVYSCV